MSTHADWGYADTEIVEKLYDEDPDMDQVLTVCRNCGGEDTLAENTMVPRSVSSYLYRDHNGELVAVLRTDIDDAFWEAETDHKWGCRSCVAEGTDFGALFEVRDL